MANISDQADVIPEQFRTDFSSVDPDRVRIESVYLMRRNPISFPMLPIAIHSGLLFVTNDGKVILARGGPINEPEDKYFPSVFAREAVFRLLRFIHSEVFGDRVKNAVDAIPQHFGDMIPVLQLLKEKRFNGADTGFDTRLFDRIVQGQGIAGLKPKSNTYIAKIADSAHPAIGDNGLPQSPQDIYRAVYGYTRTIVATMPDYNLFPTRGRPGINCHSFTAAAAQAAHIYGLVRTHMGFAIGKNRIIRFEHAHPSRLFRNPVDPFAPKHS